MKQVLDTAEISMAYTEQKKDEYESMHPFECQNCGMLYDKETFEMAKKEGKCYYCKQSVVKMEVENGK